MNIEHLKAFLQLRWRLRANQFRKAGTLNAVLAVVVSLFVVVGSVGLVVGGFALGLLVFGDVPAFVHLFTWDGIVLGLLFVWTTGLLADLQRSEALSIERFLHLPVSPAGAFLINYVSSLFSLSLLMFVPGMVGLVAGMVFSIGPRMLLVLPLMATAIFALTAVTYQFQGWLASLMANQRRRRTIMVVLTAGFILVAQLPNLINISRPWESSVDPNTRRAELMKNTMDAIQSGEITLDEYNRRENAVKRQVRDERQQARQKSLDKALHIAHPVNTILPPGWLPLGVEGLAVGAFLPALLGSLGFSLIGSFSLWRAYRTTLRLYTGEYTSGDGSANTKPPPDTPHDPTRLRLVERQLPWVSEHVSAVATAGFRALVRAPEAKMAMLTPIIMMVVFGGLVLSRNGTPPAVLRPLMVFGAGVMIMYFAGMQLLANQFGFDRSGFRAFALSPIPRRDIVFGKNLAVAPLVLGLGLVGFVIAGAVFPLRIDHYPAVAAQLVAAYLILCMMSNVTSILTPIPLAAGTSRPSGVKFGPMLLQMLVMMLMPILVAPVLLPYGVEALLSELDIVSGVPISLPLSLVVLLLVALIYRVVITVQGRWLATPGAIHSGSGDEPGGIVGARKNSRSARCSPRRPTAHRVIALRQ